MAWHAMARAAELKIQELVWEIHGFQHVNPEWVPHSYICLDMLRLLKEKRGVVNRAMNSQDMNRQKSCFCGNNVYPFRGRFGTMPEFGPLGKSH